MTLLRKGFVGKHLPHCIKDLSIFAVPCCSNLEQQFWCFILRFGIGSEIWKERKCVNICVWNRCSTFMPHLFCWRSKDFSQLLLLHVITLYNEAGWIRRRRGFFQTRRGKQFWAASSNDGERRSQEQQSPGNFFFFLSFLFLNLVCSLAASQSASQAGNGRYMLLLWNWCLLSWFTAV